MTKAEWISTIRYTLTNVDEQGLYRAPLIEKHIDSVYEQMFNEMYNQNKRSVWQYVRDYTYTNDTGASIALSTDGVQLPIKPIVMNRVGSGVFKVKTNLAVSGDVSYWITNKQGYDNVQNSSHDTAGVMGQRIAYISGDYLYANTVLTDTRDLTYSIIPKFSSLSSTDEVRIPSGYEEMMIDRIIDTIRHKSPSDLINDNTIE